MSNGDDTNPSNDNEALAPEAQDYLDAIENYHRELVAHNVELQRGNVEAANAALDRVNLANDEITAAATAALNADEDGAIHSQAVHAAMEQRNTREAEFGDSFEAQHAGLIQEYIAETKEPVEAVHPLVGATGQYSVENQSPAAAALTEELISTTATQIRAERALTAAENRGEGSAEIERLKGIHQVSILAAGNANRALQEFGPAYVSAAAFKAGERVQQEDARSAGLSTAGPTTNDDALADEFVAASVEQKQLEFDLRLAHANVIGGSVPDAGVTYNEIKAQRDANDERLAIAKQELQDAGLDNLVQAQAKAEERLGQIAAERASQSGTGEVTDNVDPVRKMGAATVGETDVATEREMGAASVVGKGAAQGVPAAQSVPNFDGLIPQDNLIALQAEQAIGQAQANGFPQTAYDEAGNPVGDMTPSGVNIAKVEPTKSPSVNTVNDTKFGDVKGVDLAATVASDIGAAVVEHVPAASTVPPVGQVVNPVNTFAPGTFNGFADGAQVAAPINVAPPAAPIVPPPATVAAPMDDAQQRRNDVFALLGAEAPPAPVATVAAGSESQSATHNIPVVNTGMSLGQNESLGGGTNLGSDKAGGSAPTSSVGSSGNFH